MKEFYNRQAKFVNEKLEKIKRENEKDSDELMKQCSFSPSIQKSRQSFRNNYINSGRHSYSFNESSGFNDFYREQNRKSKQFVDKIVA